MKQAAVQVPTVTSTIQSIRNTLLLSQEDLARVLGLSVRTVVRWEKEGAEPPPLERERLFLIREVIEIAKDIMEPEDVASWFSRPKTALSDRSPLDLLSTLREFYQCVKSWRKLAGGFSKGSGSILAIFLDRLLPQSKVIVRRGGKAR